jgi:hypothetical protein
MAQLEGQGLTIDFKSRADQGREGVEELTGRIGRVDLEDQHLLILLILTTYDKQPRELLAVEQERNQSIVLQWIILIASSSILLPNGRVGRYDQSGNTARDRSHRW